MSYKSDYKLTYVYMTENGEERSESELVHSYRQAFIALNGWLYKNQNLGYTLIKATVVEF